MLLRPSFLFLAWAAIVGGAFGEETTPTPSTGVPDLIVIMLDGFRWDYLDIHDQGGFPGFERLTQAGVQAKYLNPAYPPNSFPNWHTIVTGLYPESHGIVANYMFDNERNATFRDHDRSTTDPRWWNDTEPLWITTTLAGMDTALFLWSRCDVPWYGNVLPRYCVPHEETPPNTQLFVKHLNQAVDMIQQEGFKVAMVYEVLADLQGHAYGPESPEVAVAVRDLDLALQGFWEELDARGMMDTTNVVMLSDHGMTNSGRKDMEWLDIGPCLDYGQVVKATEHSGYINVLPAKGFTDQVEESLKNCPGISENVEVIRKENLPERYHYKAHRLIHEIMVLPKRGYYMKCPGRNYTLPESEGNSVGNHGFDHTRGDFEDMRGILFAKGPSFVTGHETGAVDQVDVYGLLCHALRLQCHDYNGTMDHVKEFFIPDASSLAAFSTDLSIFLYSLFVALSLVFVGWRGLW